MKLIIPEYMTNENLRDQNVLKDFNTRLIERFRTNDPEQITHSIMNEANLISGQLFQLWHKYLDLYKISPRFCSAVLNHDHLLRYRDRWNLYINKKQLQVNSNLALNSTLNLYQIHEQISEQMRNSIKKSLVH